MSGIAGIIHLDGRPVEPGQVKAMTAAMHYRGPDGINHWCRGNVALGQCMLRTTPESLEETQPLTNEDESLVLVMDGRVDNWEELRRKLLGKGAVLRTRADAELVLRAYEVWGRDCLPHIDGDFALVLWDARRQEAFCARDRMGNKSFTYHWIGKTLYFASEQQAILRQEAVAPVLNEGMVAEYLAAQWFSRTETLWQGVLRLDAAHTMVVTPSGPTLSRYWAPDLQASLSFRSDQEFVEHYRALLFDVVRRQSRSCYPIACEVSGGLDSSAVFAVAETMRRQGQLPAPGLEGYTLDFSGDPDADEIDYCRSVGAHLGRSIHEVTPAHLPLSWYQDTARHFCDFPEFPNGAMGLSIADAARANGSRVLLNGIGGDQWLCGSELCYAEAIAGWRGRELLNILGEDIPSAGLRTTLWCFMRFGIVPLLPERTQQALRAGFANLRGTANAGKPDWLAESMRSRFEARERVFRKESLHEVGRVAQRQQLACLNDAYQGLAIEMSERLYAQAGLEMRQPFWNARVIEFALATPERSRLRGQENKWLHRRAMEGMLPENVLQRSSKAEFSVTFARYWVDLGTHLDGTVLPRRQDWVNPQAILSMLQGCRQPDRSDWPSMAMWALWTLFGVDAGSCAECGCHRAVHNVTAVEVGS
jgi:asparagine synthase (glutamine-hydrolysing)